jgi:hypothetical protein
MEVPIEQLYFDDIDFNFNRTRSRLIEMQSERYYSIQKKQVGGITEFKKPLSIGFVN